MSNEFADLTACFMFLAFYFASCVFIYSSMQCHYPQPMSRYFAKLCQNETEGKDITTNHSFYKNQRVSVYQFEHVFFIRLVWVRLSLFRCMVISFLGCSSCFLSTGSVQSVLLYPSLSGCVCEWVSVAESSCAKELQAVTKIS